MRWVIDFHPACKAEFDELAPKVQDALLAMLVALRERGPALGRPDVDTLNGSAFANVKELRFRANRGVWRVAFAFDPQRRGILRAGVAPFARCATSARVGREIPQGPTHALAPPASPPVKNDARSSQGWAPGPQPCRAGARASQLVAGDKAGVSDPKFYKRLIAKADARFEEHLKHLDLKERPS